MITSTIQSASFSSQHGNRPIPWITHLPAAWATARLKYVVSNCNVTVDGANSGDNYVALDQVESWTGRRVQPEERPFPESTVRCFRKGDVLFGKLRPYLAKTWLADADGVCTGEMLVLRPSRRVRANFLKYVLLAPTFIDFINSSTYGARMPRAEWSFIGNSEFPIPPIDKQDAIVAFLDRKLADIDRCVASKRRLIGLLEEQKAIIRSAAVVHGLNPHSQQLRDSGVWCEPKMRSEWTATTLGRLLRGIEQGWSPVAANGELRDDQWGVLTLSSVKKGVFYPRENKPLPPELEPKRRYEVRPGDFLLTRSNTKQLVADACIVEDTRPRLMLCDLIYRLTIREGIIDPRFLLHQLLSKFGRSQIEADARGSSSTMAKISQGHISRWIVLLPPHLGEQAEIVSHIETEHRAIDDVINRALRDIDLLNEFRSSLIAEAVTGKIDVRSKA